jgi:hypothetical protein
MFANETDRLIIFDDRGGMRLAEKIGTSNLRDESARRSSTRPSQSHLPPFESGCGNWNCENKKEETVRAVKDRPEEEQERGATELVIICSCVSIADALT